MIYTLPKTKEVLEPELEPWGQRTCYIADPEGNLIEMRKEDALYVKLQSNRSD